MMQTCCFDPTYFRLINALFYVRSLRKWFGLQRHVNKCLSRKVDRKRDGIIYCRGGLMQFVLLLVAAAEIDGELQSLPLCLSPQCNVTA